MSWEYVKEREQEKVRSKKCKSVTGRGAWKGGALRNVRRRQDGIYGEDEQEGMSGEGLEGV